MRLQDVKIVSREQRAEGLFALALESRELAHATRPGQFLNIRIDNSFSPLLRRPFSVSRVNGDLVEVLFNVVGRGTEILSGKRPGDALNVLGPLGVPFHVEGGYSLALIVAGGLGVAPFPLLSSVLQQAGKKIQTFLGARTVSQVTQHYLQNVHVATDDGSMGFHGTVVQLLEDSWKKENPKKTKIFGCGPTRMMKALSEFARNREVDCELSLEGDMACGIGICQGCPVERASGEKKYSLVCVEGPAFNSNDVILG
jgi:dihydroorotate dehydrogenase electron transfer subunit